MSTLESIVDLLTHRHPGAVEVLVGPAARAVGDIRLVDRVDQVDDAPANALIVLERALAPLTGDYRFDIVVRRAAAREVAALVVVLPENGRVSLTALALARRAAIAVIRLAPEVDLTAAIGTIVRQASDHLSVTVDRARAVSEVIDARAFDDVGALLDRVGLLLGRTVSIGPRPEEDQLLAVPGGSGDSWLWTKRPDDASADALLEMVLWRIAAETTRLSTERVRAEQTSRRSAGEVLAQLVAADRPTRATLAPSARRLGIPVDGWHVITRIEPDNLLEVAGDDVAAYEIRDELAAIALQAAGSMSGSWHVAHDPAVVLLLWTGVDPPGKETHARLHRQVDFVIKAMARQVRGLRMFCGTGSARPGIAGLASSATEARLAVSSARFRRRSNTPVHYDAVGMRATLLEWYGSPTVQQSIDQLFAPVADLAPAKRQAMIDTLCIYLDLQGSAARTAEVLHLHRNAVRYRVQRAFELLGIDEDDADERLFLHLACRAQRLGDTAT